MSDIRPIDANALKEDFQDRLRKAHNWKENALNNGNYESVIRADATIGFICEVIMTINNAPTVEPEDLERTGYWETPEPDYARDGTRLPIRVAICSECQKPNKLPVGRYCSECGSRNKE